MIIWLLCEISLTFACGSENNNQCDDFNYNFIHVFVLISKSISSVLFVIYLAFHTKNIRFSEWMYDILKGHRLCSKYEECSIFIIKSCCLRRNEKDHLMETPCTINEASMESNEETTVLDYDTSNHYMKSYLEEYQK